METLVFVSVVSVPPRARATSERKKTKAFRFLSIPSLRSQPTRPTPRQMPLASSSVCQQRQHPKLGRPGAQRKRETMTSSHECKYCFEEMAGNPVSYCACIGTLAYVHPECLMMCLRQTKTNNCGICHKPIAYTYSGKAGWSAPLTVEKTMILIFLRALRWGWITCYQCNHGLCACVTVTAACNRAKCFFLLALVPLLLNHVAGIVLDQVDQNASLSSLYAVTIGCCQMLDHLYRTFSYTGWSVRLLTCMEQVVLGSSLFFVWWFDLGPYGFALVCSLAVWLSMLWIIFISTSDLIIEMQREILIDTELRVLEQRRAAQK